MPSTTRNSRLLTCRDDITVKMCSGAWVIKMSVREDARPNLLDWYSDVGLSEGEYHNVHLGSWNTQEPC